MVIVDLNKRSWDSFETWYKCENTGSILAIEIYSLVVQHWW